MSKRRFEPGRGLSVRRMLRKAPVPVVLAVAAALAIAAPASAVVVPAGPLVPRPSQVVSLPNGMMNFVGCCWVTPIGTTIYYAGPLNGATYYPNGEVTWDSTGVWSDNTLPPTFNLDLPSGGDGVDTGPLPA